MIDLKPFSLTYISSYKNYLFDGSIREESLFEQRTETVITSATLDNVRKNANL